MTFKEIEKILKKNEWIYHHTNGSHYIFKNNENKVVVVPKHKGDIPKGTLNSILKQAGLK